jgi:hypothetical protein
METKSLKALARKILERNHEGKSQETESFSDALAGVGKKETIKKAQGYGCACGHNIYHQIEDFLKEPGDASWEHNYRLSKVWQCENCQAVFEIIGGIKGPQNIN